MILQYAPEFLALFTVNFLNILSPGPETALMVYNSSRYSRKVGLFTGFGIVCGTMIHKTYTLLGFGMVVAKSPTLFMIIKYAGSAYMMYLGYRMFFPKKKQVEHVHHPKNLTPKQAFRMGFLMDILHPGSSLFFMSIVAATVSTSTPLAVQGIYGVLLICTSICWYSALATVFSNKHLQKVVLNIGPWIDRITGVTLILLAIRLALFTIK
jgi:threonine/homoserine/homoserine lactone efflux protein